jgi:hypothetical protein
VREKIPLEFGFCKRTFELKLPRFASACICHLLLNSFLFGSKIDSLYHLHPCSSMIPTKTRLQYANGYLELGMINEASEEIESIMGEVWDVIRGDWAKTHPDKLIKEPC